MQARVNLSLRLGMAMALIAPLHATDAAVATRRQLAAGSCSALLDAARALPGNGPMLLPSYPDLHGDGDRRALQNVAFVYDNAVAGIALTACGQPAQARRIADALLLASTSDPSFRDGRLRNAYRAGPSIDGKIELPGYWNPHGNFWSQDAYQVGTATGNVAWAALLLLTAYQSSHDARYLAGAIAQLRWIDAHALGNAAPAGYEGGLYGYDNAQRAQRWKSTEQNIDVYAAATWASRYGAKAELARQMRIARGFVGAMWNGSEHRFFIGTRDDGTTISRDKSGLDSQVWPLLAFRPLPPGWNQVWSWVATQHRSGAGYGYRRAPDGIWTEGSAQVAAALQGSGRPVPDALWRLLATQRSEGGMLYATPQSRIGTDLAIGPDSTHADFYYYHLPHLGATAWAALAAKGWNPFTGRPITAAAESAP